MSKVIEISSLQKKYSSTIVLDNISLSLESGPL